MKLTIGYKDEISQPPYSAWDEIDTVRMFKLLRPFLSIELLNLSVRARNSLLGQQKKFLGDLQVMTSDDWLRLPKCGMKTMEEIDLFSDHIWRVHLPQLKKAINLRKQRKEK